ncbi:MAG TPA: glycosyltransferase family 4 protein [Rhodanobacteraceae bacterium]|nr:glycosyltransferase family 4 protein [Rhodanobacteraceae bacterium]
MRTQALRSFGAPRRVLMTADTVGGVWQYAMELCRVLCARGYEITLATMGGLPDREQLREAESIPGLDLRASRYKLLWMDDPWRDVDEAGEWLLGLAQELQPDIVHLNDLGHGGLDWPAPVLTVGHSCVLSWWRAVHGERAPESQWARYRECVTAGLHASKMVVAPTQAMMSSLQCFYGPLRNTQVIPNGRSSSLMTGADQKAQTQQAPSATKRDIIFSAGRVWDEGKNISSLAAIAARVPWPVCIAGPQQSPGHESGRVGFLNVRMLGKLDGEAMRRWFGKASSYALPARYEPFGLSVLEAAQAGCALVLGDIDSLRENWEGAALFVPPNDPDALAFTLRRLITDDVLRTRNMARAQRRAMHLTPRAMADAYIEAYDELCLRRRFGSGATTEAHA